MAEPTRCRRAGLCPPTAPPCPWRTGAGMCGAANDRLLLRGPLALLNGRALPEGALLRVYLPVNREEVYGRLHRREDGAWVLVAGERRIRLLSGVRAKEV